MIDDVEMRELFKLESDEHLSVLESNLMQLEQQPDNKEILQEMFREAHSLKGSARMLGVYKVMEVSHALEDLFGKAQRGDIVFTPAIIERIYPVVDAIGKFVAEATTDARPGIEVKGVLEYLRLDREMPTSKTRPLPQPQGEEPKAPPPSPSQEPASAVVEAIVAVEMPPAVKPTPVDETTDVAEASTAIPAPVVEAQTMDVAKPQETTPEYRPPTVDIPGKIDSGKNRIETIRVDTRKLDSLMTHAGELSVTKTSIIHRFKEINGITSFCDDWNSDVLSRYIMLKEMAHGNELLSKALVDFFNLQRSRFEKLNSSLNELKTGWHGDNTRLESVTKKLHYEIRTVSILPIKTLFRVFPRLVRDISVALSKSVDLVIEGGETTVDRQIIEELKDPIMHLLRNAIDHGIEGAQERLNCGKPATATIVLRAYKHANQIIVEVEDDGCGINTEEIKRTALKHRLTTEEQLQGMTLAHIHGLIFTPGLSTSSMITDVSGRGVGLDVVATRMEALKGSARVESVQGKGCVFRLKMPVNMTTTRVLVVMVAGLRFAIPVEFVTKSFVLARKDIFRREGRDTIKYEDQPISLALLSDLLELDRVPSAKGMVGGEQSLTCIILSSDDQLVGVIVGQIVDEQEVVLKRYSTLLQRVRNISGAAILETGEVCAILNPADLIRSALKRKSVRISEEVVQQQSRLRRILLVEDTITTRTLIKRVLDSAAYEVVTAIDGLDALNKLPTRDFDAVVSDIQMPNMDGLTLAETIRADKKYKDLPIVLITALSSDEDKKRGMKAGANAYITKPTFDHKVLLDVLKRLI
ncbi:hybrid sensor histidine kinase/response regulator [Candidatus Magnetobacterium casense]|uniref:hybrid sensor histidine kinase/response regulator n=1 Tax=Candidatus Magnetobacterium casense TaxID=1455061 RepID=UPI00058C89B9|nr:hybrid sensor histidine kinase/response regulator [Candidatus Magnetobacterium casensis]